MKVKVDRVNMWLRGNYFNKNGEKVLRRNLDMAKGVVDGFTIVINPLVKKPYHTSAYTDSQILNVARIVKEEGFSVDSIMYWLTATQACVDYVPSHFERLKNLLNREGIEVDHIDLDCEGHSNANGWGDKGSFFSPGLAYGLKSRGIRPSINFVVGNNGMRRQEFDLSKQFNNPILTPQAYSQYNPSKRWTHNELFRAGTFQELILKKIDRTLGEYEFGFMCAFQTNHPDVFKSESALQVAVDTYLQGLPEAKAIRIWDSKITGEKHYEWLSNLKKEHEPMTRDILSDRRYIMSVQRMLNTQGHNLVVDGIAGPKTLAAMAKM